MPDRDLISATIAAALIQSGQFKLEWFDATGKPLERQNEFTSRTESEHRTSTQLVSRTSGSQHNLLVMDGHGP
jgi:hypothetical protein